jgi:hypothetical protein
MNKSRGVGAIQISTGIVSQSSVTLLGLQIDDLL